jgi:hypothetical protein
MAENRAQNWATKGLVPILLVGTSGLNIFGSMDLSPKIEQVARELATYAKHFEQFEKRIDRLEVEKERVMSRLAVLEDRQRRLRRATIDN